MNFMTFLFAQGTEPAGGAAIGEIVIATLGAGIVTAVLLVFGFGHRTGRIGALGRLADFSARVSGLPGWAALPSAVATFSLLTAVFGMYWDIALHIGVGRDEGPLANPAHYFILIGLFGIFSAGFLAMVLPTEKPSTTAVKLGKDWYAPLGGVLICACGAFALIGFPLDDMWHRIFGQDVTLWGPTHLMLIGGASMTLVGIAVLIVEARRAKVAAGKRVSRWSLIANGVAGTGGFMLGLSTFQAEFDFGVPQFRFVFQPMLIMLAAGVGLVAIRMYAGKGAAIAAVAFFVAIRGFLAISIGPVLGETMPHFPLYLVEALVVEAVALKIASRERPLAYGLASGVGIGTVGLAAEWGWSHVFMPLPWPSELLPEAALLGFATAIAASLIGTWIGYRLNHAPQPHRADLRTGAVIGATALAVLIAAGLYKPADEGLRASVQLTELQGAPDREVAARVTLSPRDAADDAEWLTMTAWQGDGLIVDRLRRVGEGVYETTQPIPVHGNWKSLVRLHRGNSLTAVPVFLPRDVAIPAPEVPAPASFERAFVADHKILQREQKEVSGALPFLGYAVVVGIALALLALLAWGLHRLGADGTSLRPNSRPERSKATARSPLPGPSSPGKVAT
jgi:hypothetical protein